MSDVELKFKIKVDGGKNLNDALETPKKQLVDLTNETKKYSNETQKAFVKSKKQVGLLTKETTNFGKKSAVSIKKPVAELAKLDSISRGMGNSMSSAGIKTAAAFGIVMVKYFLGKQGKSIQLWQVVLLGLTIK